MDVVLCLVLDMFFNMFKYFSLFVFFFERERLIFVLAYFIFCFYFFCCNVVVVSFVLSVDIFFFICMS